MLFRSHGMEFLQVAIMGKHPVAAPQFAHEGVAVFQRHPALRGLADMRDDIARLDRIAFDQLGHRRGDGRLVVDEMAHAGAFEKGDAPAVVVGIGMAAAHGEAGKTKDNVGVIIYNRGISRFTPETVAKLCERNPNLVGFKDGVGDIEAMSAMFLTMGDRLAYLGGLPTAEVYAAAYKALGTPVYSSAVFNFIPKTAIRFYEAVKNDDHATQHHLLKTFFMPYLEIRIPPRKGLVPLW